MDDDRRVIVIGSGPTGVMAALTLLRKGVPVTMLESGGGFPSAWLVRGHGRNVYQKRPHLQPSTRLFSSHACGAVWYEALVAGGLSNYWTGAVPRFAPEDFFDGARLHERYHWPLSYEDLVPYYKQAERLLMVGGAMHDVPNLPASYVTYKRRLPEQWQRIGPHAASFGHGFTTLPLAEAPPWSVQRTVTGFNSFAQVVPLLRRFRAFQLHFGAHALHLDWQGAKKKVVSVTYFDRTAQAERRLACAAVVVAAGAIASTKLLLDSTCADFPTGLGDTEGLLGHYLHDHAHHWFSVELDNALPRLGRPAYLTRAPYHESPPLVAAQCTIAGSSDALWEKALNFTPMPTRSLGVLIFGATAPRPGNQVRLCPSVKDEFGLPMLTIDMRFDEEAFHTIRAAQDRLLAIFKSAGYRGTIHGSLATLTPGTSVHYGGTVRMHSSPRYGVLNGWNCLHAVDNVVVADASCFTTSVEKNPTVTAMALAARAADRLAVDLKMS